MIEFDKDDIQWLIDHVDMNQFKQLEDEERFNQIKRAYEIKIILIKLSEICEQDPEFKALCGEISKEIFEVLKKYAL